MGDRPCRGRSRCLPVPAALSIAVLLAACSTPDTALEPSIHLTDDGQVIEVRDLQGLAQFQRQDPGAEQWQQLLSLSVVTDRDAEPPAVLGSYEPDGEVLRFVPRYGLSRGLTYRTRLDTAVLTPGTGPTVVLEFSLPELLREPQAEVTRIYPTADRLPENLLRFYIHFSEAMGRGHAYEHVRLLDASGDTVEGAFLELGEELWDRTGMRFTLLFEPGRIKRGLVPHEELGPVLVQGNRYTLVVDAGFLDADGLPLVDGFRKTFAVVEPVMARLDPAQWNLQSPPAGTREPLVVTFPHSMDHALLNRMLWVTDPAGEEVRGEVVVDSRETRWSFVPVDPWTSGAHELVMDTTIEDIAGNSVKAAFDVDVFETGQRVLEVETAGIGFTVSR